MSDGAFFGWHEEILQTCKALQHVIVLEREKLRFGRVLCGSTVNLWDEFTSESATEIKSAVVLLGNSADSIDGPPRKETDLIHPEARECLNAIVARLEEEAHLLNVQDLSYHRWEQAKLFATTEETGKIQALLGEAHDDEVCIRDRILGLQAAVKLCDQILDRELAIRRSLKAGTGSTNEGAVEKVPVEPNDGNTMESSSTIATELSPAESGPSKACIIL
mmetsp:Transcript_38095/g.61689  ORF Transcript_38095/g.61689 Transcript_38095/m.61689 type:complete len:220 (-) Transcript_38095:330-989(-)|eukprot:CAMPEP_0184370812 /NCGR_PEP_ID=MMETSP1089-20130417/163042_1 /TAXON_ID=38269 ORGANISM="Gloeochaete wittrockiana, Strain SAG46.84" /NCGR_SAMPLE_ID=MMETSP1089 /ASSEMBLY_ACC=CAM_ASM_000445 /LENGTH=219 /DNA_ID=CAMNT_0026713475 /DNA_START=75 /DNA_END=734 /DNA_ORIENTATION=+